MSESSKPTSTTADLESVTLVRDSKLRQMLGDISAPTLWRMRSNPELGFPRKIQISPGVGGTRLCDIAAYLEKRTAR